METKDMAFMGDSIRMMKDDIIRTLDNPESTNHHVVTLPEGEAARYAGTMEYNVTYIIEGRKILHVPSGIDCTPVATFRELVAILPKDVTIKRFKADMETKSSDFAAERTAKRLQSNFKDMSPEELRAFAAKLEEQARELEPSPT